LAWAIDGQQILAYIRLVWAELGIRALVGDVGAKLVSKGKVVLPAALG
jgi:hypothetical protein